jgi:hypothetical protein
MAKRLRFRIRHFMIAVGLAALWLAVARDDIPCTPLAPVLAFVYLCGGLGAWGARVRGRRVRTGLLVGVLLGPLGVIWAWSNPIPERFLPPAPEVTPHLTVTEAER